MRQKRIIQKNKLLRNYLKKGGRKEARKDFNELLNRAAKINHKP